MIKANDDDRQLIIELLAKSFEDNQSINYIIRQDGKKPERIRALMDYSVRICTLFGEVWLSNDKKACALILFPHLKKTTLTSVWLDVKLIFKAIGLSGIRKTLDREAKIKQLQPKRDMLYLWFIGVNPLYQHRGTGGHLLKEILAHATGLGLPVYLETSTKCNLPWYDKHGFTAYDTLDLGYKLHFLKYEPLK